MALFSLTEWAPDQAGFDSPALAVATNTLPIDDGYGPFPGISLDEGQISSGEVRGGIEYEYNGTAERFVGTATKLYRENAGTYDDVTRAVGGDYALGDTDFWSFEAFGDYIIAVNGVDDPQKFELNGGTNFEALGGSPPVFESICVHKDFVMGFENTSDGQSSVQWSGVADSEIYDGTSLSDIQPIADGGPGKAIINAGDCVFYFQERKVHRFVYNSNPDIIFTRDEVEAGRGCVGVRALAADAGTVFFLAHDGFYSITPSLVVEAIGAGRVNEFFNSRCAVADQPLTFATIDPTYTRVIFSYRSISAGSEPYDEHLIYDWRLKRWSFATFDAQWLMGASTAAWTLEDLEAEYGTLEDVPEPLSSRRWRGGRGQLGVFNAAGYFGTMTGSNLEAVFETSTKFAPAEKVKLAGRVMAMIDTNTWTSAVGTIERTGDGLTWSSDVAPNVSGWSKHRVAGRGMRFRMTVPAGTSWTKAQGLEVQAIPSFAPER